MKLKISELFYSVQGEGRYMGVPSVFLRTFGCNFQCAGFGMPRGEKTTEVDAIIELNDKFKYKTYGDLPLVKTGCDSYASWHPKFRHLSPTYENDELADMIVDTLPFKEWREEHLVITGGEPLLGWQREYPDLLNQPRMQKLKEITIETNGTQPLHEDFRYFLSDWTSRRSSSALTFSVSAKLSCSGEKKEDAICPDVVAEYSHFGYTYLKFVIANEQDAEEALEAVKEYRLAGFDGHVYLMPVGGDEHTYRLNNKAVANLAMRNGLRYSDRLQVPLFKNEWGT